MRLLVILSLTALSGCVMHTPWEIVASSKPIPEQYVMGKRATLESCGVRWAPGMTMEQMYRKLRGKHDALIEITITHTTFTYPIGLFNEFCTTISATPVYFGTAESRTAAVRAKDAPPGRAAHRLVQLVYEELERPMPTGKELTSTAELMEGLSARGKSPTEILNAVRLGAAKHSRKASLTTILKTGFAEVEAEAERLERDFDPDSEEYDY